MIDWFICLYILNLCIYFFRLLKDVGIWLCISVPKIQWSVVFPLLLNFYFVSAGESHIFSCCNGLSHLWFDIYNHDLVFSPPIRDIFLCTGTLYGIFINCTLRCDWKFVRIPLQSSHFYPRGNLLQLYFLTYFSILIFQWDFFTDYLNHCFSLFSIWQYIRIYFNVSWCFRLCIIMFSAYVHLCL